MNLSLRILLGTLFIISATLKLLGIDGFELYIFKTISLNWLITTILVRLLIALEFTIGLFYLLGIAVRKINILSLVIISGFSAWLVFQLFKGETENCHCFGEAVQMGPAASLIKNLIILVFIFLIFKFNSVDKFSVPKRYSSLGFGIVVCLSLLVPFIVSPPDFLVANRYNLRGVATDIDFAQLDSVPWRGTDKTIKITEGKKLVVFMSMKCKMCRKAAKKLTIINSRYSDTLPVSYIFFGDSANMQDFWETSESFQFPYKIISSFQFFSITKQMPTVFFLNDGKVIKTVGYRNLNDNDVTSFLNLK